MRRPDRKGKTNMTNYEMVELLRQKANVSYEEAKAALEASDWDLLDAIVLLEREGKVPENDARFSTKAEEEKADEVKKKKDRDGAFKDGARTVGGIFRRMLNYGNRNYIVASRDGKEVISLPLTAFVLLLLIPPITLWLMLVLMIIGLFFGLRYSLRGDHPSNEKVNEYIHKAEDAAERVKESWQEKDGDTSK